MRAFRVVPSRLVQRLPVICFVGFMQSVKICRLNFPVDWLFAFLMLLLFIYGNIRGGRIIPQSARILTKISHLLSSDKRSL